MQVLDSAGERLRQYGFQHVTVVWDGFVEASYGPRLLSALHGCSVGTVLVDGTSDIHDITERAFQLTASDVVIGMGGGAVIDVAKYTRLLAEAGRYQHSYIHFKRRIRKQRLFFNG